MWGYPRISIFSCRNSGSGLYYSYSAYPKTPISIGHTWPFWDCQFSENVDFLRMSIFWECRFSENVDFLRMSIFWECRFSENVDFLRIMWGYPRISIFACRHSLSGLLYSYSACPKTPISIGHTWPFWKSRFFENNLRVSENINFLMSEFGLGTILFVFSVPENPYFDRAYMAFLRKSIFWE